MVLSIFWSICCLAAAFCALDAAKIFTAGGYLSSGVNFCILAFKPLRNESSFPGQNRNIFVQFLNIQTRKYLLIFLFWMPGKIRTKHTLILALLAQVVIFLFSVCCTVLSHDCLFLVFSSLVSLFDQSPTVSSTNWL